MGPNVFISPLFEPFYVDVRCKRADNNSWHIFQIVPCNILRLYKNWFETSFIDGPHLGTKSWKCKMQFPTWVLLLSLSITVRNGSFMFKSAMQFCLGMANWRVHKRLSRPVHFPSSLCCTKTGLFLSSKQVENFSEVAFLHLFPKLQVFTWYVYWNSFIKPLHCIHHDWCY